MDVKSAYLLLYTLPKWQRLKTETTGLQPRPTDDTSVLRYSRNGHLLGLHGHLHSFPRTCTGDGLLGSVSLARDTPDG